MAIYLIDYENTGVKGLHGIERLREDDLVIIFYGPKTGAVPFDEHVRISTAASHVEYIKTTKTAKNYLDFQLTTYLGYLVAQTAVRIFRIVSKDSGYDSVVDFWGKKGMDIKRQENVAGDKKTTESGKKKTAAKQGKNGGSRKQSPVKADQKVEAEVLQPVTEVVQEETVSENQVTEISNQPVQPEAAISGENKKEETAKPQIPKTVPESTRKKIRAALKQENPHAGVYRAIYACMLQSTDKQSFNTALVRQFTQEKGNKYYKAVLPAFSEWIKKGE